MALLRRNEPELVMETPESVEAFNWAGSPGGPLYATYHVLASAVSRGVPEGATVVDVFCGSGRFLRRLLRGRPDLRGIGVDLSGEMLRLAATGFAEDGLTDRVELVRADARDLDRVVGGPVAAIVSMSALHHCPTRDDLVAVLAAIARVQARDGAAVWLFDLVRPDDEALLERIPRSYEIVAGARLPPAFRADWITSLHAGWTVAEFSDAARDAGLVVECSTGDYSQLHRALPSSAGEGPAWTGPEPDDADRRRIERLAAALRLG